MDTGRFWSLPATVPTAGRDGRRAAGLGSC